VPEASGEVDPFLEEETELVQSPLTTGHVVDHPSECPAGNVRCYDGSCSPTCTNAGASPRYMEEYRVHPTEIPAPPEVAGSAQAYEQQATNYHAQEDAADYSAITHAEVAQGLADAAQDSKEAERAEEISAEKAKVETEFNQAAAKAADYKEKAHEDDLAIMKVKQARITEQEQEKVVEEAKKTLAAEEQKLKMDHQMVLNAESDEQHAKYTAEWAGQQYTQAKTTAIADDNRLKEQEHETMQEQHYREVARAAVVAEAEREAAAAQAAAAAANPPVAPVKVVPAATVVEPVAQGSAANTTDVKTTPAKTVTCQDCTTLPPMYSNQGGSCSDCPTWASEGMCTKPSFKLFMSHYCAASCGCSVATATAVTTELLQMPAVAGLQELDEEEEED